MGSGVAGLQAIATAKKESVLSYMHPTLENLQQEQIESVSGRFIEVDGMDDFLKDEAGYAKPLTPEFIQEGQ